MPGDDDMGSTDPGPQDMGAMSGDEDMGSTDPGPRDMGAMDGVIPPRTRACPSGPLDAPVDGCRPAPPPSTGDPYLDCVRRINQFRWECQCLPPLERWTEGESCADQQAQYDADNNTPHKGFRDNVCSPRGFAQNECPRWGSWDRVIGGCLQQMWDEGPGEPFSEHGHYINMSSQRYTRVACGQGGGWYVQNFQ
jgi:hypothetical protein